MNFSREQFRFYIFARSKLGDDAIQIHADLCVVAGDTAPIRAIRRWLEDKVGQWDSFEDTPRAGRPPSIVNNQNSTEISSLIGEDARLTIAELLHTLE